jgi:hypothetical protein
MSVFAKVNQGNSEREIRTNVLSNKSIKLDDSEDKWIRTDAKLAKSRQWARKARRLDALKAKSIGTREDGTARQITLLAIAGYFKGSKKLITTIQGQHLILATMSTYGTTHSSPPPPYVPSPASQ